MKNRVVTILLLVILVVVIPLAACTQPAGPATSTSSPSAPAATTTASPKPITWKLHHWRPAVQDEVPYMQQACDEIKKLSGGRLTIDIYPDFSLGYKSSTWLRDIKSGIIDITCVYNSFTAGEEPSFTILEAPQIWKNREQTLLVANAFFPFKQKVYKEVWGGEMLAQGTILEGPNEYIFFKGRTVKTLADMNGLKIRIPGGIHKDLFTKLGIVPQSLTLGEAYMAIKTGVMDGIRTGSGSVNQLKLYEVIDQSVELNAFAALSQDLVVSDRAWRELPDDLKPIVRSVWEKWATGMMAHVVHCGDVDNVYWQKQNEAKGVKYSTLPDADLAKIRQIALTVVEEWAVKTGGRTLDAYKLIKPFVVPQKEPGKPVIFTNN